MAHITVDVRDEKLLLSSGTESIDAVPAPRIKNGNAFPAPSSNKIQYNDILKIEYLNICIFLKIKKENNILKIFHFQRHY
jgi:hypothetical protein